MGGAAVEVVRIPVAGADAAARLGDALDAARAEGGYLAAPRCESVRAYAGSDDGEASGADEPRTVLVLVAWSSRAAHDEAVAEPAAAAFFAAVGELAAGPPSTGWYDELR